MRKFLVVLDDTKECLNAMRFAALRAEHTGGAVQVISIIPPEEFQHWMGVADLMRQVSQRTQVLVVSHADGLVRPLLGGADDDPSSTELSDEDPDRADQPGRCLDGSSGSVLHHHLVKCDGETMVEGQGLLTTPSWEWGRR